MCWEVLEAPRSLRRCSTLSATCQSAGRAARALFSSGMFCTSQPSCFIRLLELLQAAGKMSSPGCFLSRTERVPSVQLPAGCSPRLTPYQEGTRRQFPSRLLDFCLQQPQGLPLEVWGVAFSQESGGPALSHGFGSPPGWPLEVFHVHCDSPAHKSGIYLAFLMEMGSPVCLLICFSLQELLMGISARFQESPR